MKRNFTTLTGLVQFLAQKPSNPTAFNYREGNSWRSISTENFLESVRRLSLGLHALGIRRKDKIGLVADSSPYWLICDLAIQIAGAISVPLTSYTAEKNFLFEVRGAGIKTLIVLEHDQWETIVRHRSLFDRLIIHNVHTTHAKEPKFIDLMAVMALGDELAKKQPELYKELCEHVREDDLAAIIYTSGVTGVPKGVELTHRNLVKQIEASSLRFPMREGEERALSLLPLSHAFQRLLTYFYASWGASIYFLNEPSQIGKALREIRPTYSGMVPLILERIYERIEAQVEKMGFFSRKIYLKTLAVAKKQSLTFFERFWFWIGRQFIYPKINKSVGASFVGLISGGSALDEQLCRSFLNFGVPVYQGYGLTEAAPVLSTNYPGHNKPGTCGPAFPFVELKLSERGEVLARGPNIMRGYHDRIVPHDVFVDSEGWLHTGDWGSIDQDGYLTILGRFKDLLKTSSGKMVAPVPIENAICQDPLIDRAMLVADNRKYVTCLLVPNREELSKFQEQHGLKNLSQQELLDSDLIKMRTEALIEWVNSNLNEWEKIRAYRYVPQPLTVEAGELTATLKVCRRTVIKKYAALIEQMYANGVR